MDGEGGKKFPSQCDLLCKPAEVEQMIQDASSEFRAGGPEDAAYFPAIRGDHLGARDMLEDDEGKSEIVGLVGHSG